MDLFLRQFFLKKRLWVHLKTAFITKIYNQKKQFFYQYKCPQGNIHNNLFLEVVL